MADNLQLPKDITKLFELKDTSQPLRRLLIQILNKQNELENRIAELENGN